MSNTLGVPAQLTVGREPAISQTGYAQWDLNQYVWSHTLAKGNKPPLDFEAIDNWPVLEPGNLSSSPNGRYFAYTIERGFGPSYKRPDSLVVQSTNNSWRKTFPGGSPGFFQATANNIYSRTRKHSAICPQEANSHAA
ncbi:hypothetical protein [Paraflavitalea speifideaquila]|uniref:hypothetical protein n=1 Tax=Paraflavitalea speifideaquila TaxID=3076558 RepID=UPI0028EEDB67|nr:hypothetical protein [Paraflavitalea speifideiaquila]